MRQNLGIDFEVFLFCTSMRWLSVGKVLNRIFALKIELMQFLQFEGKQDLKNTLTQSKVEHERLFDFFDFE